MLIRVYNYNTMDKVKVFEAHTDYIRSGFVPCRQHLTWEEATSTAQIGAAWTCIRQAGICISVADMTASTVVGACSTCRCIAVHPTLPVFLTSSDDTLIKLWDWDKGFMCVQQFEGHSHFVMQVGWHSREAAALFMNMSRLLYLINSVRYAQH
jgi:coatomer subunit beta'